MNPIKEKTMNFYLQKIAAAYGEKPALAFVDGESFSYNDLIKTASITANKLEAAGIPEKAKVVIISENSPWFAPVYLGVTASNRTIVPVLTDFSVEEIRNILKHSEADAFFVSAKLADRMAPLQEEFNIPFFITDGIKPLSSGKEEADAPTDMAAFKQALAKIDLSETFKFFSQFEIDPQSLCSLIYTSGTTGTPKGVMLTHFNILSNVEDADDIPGEVTTPNTLSILPLAHALECTVGMLVPLHKGCHLHYLARQLSVPYLMASLKKVQPGIILIVPLMVDKIYRKTVLGKVNAKAITRSLYKIPFFRKLIHKKAGAKLLEAFGGKVFYCGIGGAKLAEDTETFLREGNFPYAIGYGLTETSPAAVGSGAHNSRYRAAGFPLPNVEIKIDKPDPKTGAGEVLIRGPIVMAGYYKEPELTAEVMTEDDFFKSGDLGFMKKGYLYICGRSKNVIIGANGENIYPENIETEINSCAFVEESIVYEHDKHGIVAKIHLNMEEFKKHLEELKESVHNIEEKAAEHLKHIQQTVNNRISSFSRIRHVFDQPEPFEKTPKKSIKRYLYTA